MESVGAGLSQRLGREQGAEVGGADEDQALLLQQVAQSDQLVKVRPDRTPPLYRVLGQVGESTSVALRSLLGLLAFFGALLIATWNIIKHQSRFRFTAVVQRFEVVGVHVLGIKIGRASWRERGWQNV